MEKLSKTQIAKLLSVSPRTITRWVRDFDMPVSKEEIFPGKEKKV